MTQNGNSQQVEWVRSVLHRYEGPLVSYAARLVGDAERARDIVQETFLRLCRQDRANIEGHLPEWLFTVCRNLALDVRRKESRMSTATDTQFGQAASPDAGPNAAVERQDLAQHVLGMVSQLPENQQEVIRLKFHGGLSYREISEVTGHSVSNVGFLIHRGLKTVRERLKHSEHARL